MNGRKLKLGAVALLASMLLVGMERPPITSSLCNIVESYQDVKNTHAPMGMWERLVYTIALSKQRAAECKAAAHGAV